MLFRKLQAAQTPILTMDICSGQNCSAPANLNTGHETSVPLPSEEPAEGGMINHMSYLSSLYLPDNGLQTQKNIL